ncbi:MAG TPA: DUF6763 family protein [Steroidobacteraceae bacterium]|nr:DUF6763 family protein [Steroidobacteraceae bacterium]
MNSGVGVARIGQWYTRWDKGEIFQVTSYDQSARTIGIQKFDGDLDQIDEEAWHALPLAFAEPLQSLRAVEQRGACQDTTAEQERDAESEGGPVERLVLDEPIAAQRLGPR